MNGVLIVDKPKDYTSFDVVAVARGLSKERKIGHTGTLDPMATGVLPLLFGRAAKAADLLPDTDKEYLAGFVLGEGYDTGDITGRLVKTDGSPVSFAGLEGALGGFRGEIMQTPPMYSAVSVGGKRLYQLARQGLQVERKPRPVTISVLELVLYDQASRRGVLKVSCSKGTYIRALIEDIAGALGTVGAMTDLRRTMACGFCCEEAIDLELLRCLGAEEIELLLRPVDSLFEEYPQVCVSGPQSVRFKNGGALDMGRLRMPRIAMRDGQRVRIYGPNEEFIGLGEALLSRQELKFLKLLGE